MNVVEVYNTRTVRAEEIPRNVTHVKVGRFVREIEPHAFDECKSLEAVEFENDGRLTSIGYEAFLQCTTLMTIAVPPTIQSIGRYAFCDCHSLVYVSLPATLQIIPKGCFWDCVSLIKVKTPASLEVIGARAFCNCDELTSIELPKGLKIIGEYAFSFCISLRNILIPCTTVVGLGAFEYCMLLLRRCPSEDSDGITKGPLFQKFCCFRRDLNTVDDSLLNSLRCRFKKLPLHKICYFQAHHSTDEVIKQLKQLSRRHASSVKQRDCFGMTPLHILTNSAAPNCIIIQAILLKYPKSLCSKDDYGNLPLNYAVRMDVPVAVVRLLVETQQSLFPDNKLNWGLLVDQSIANSVDLLKFLLHSSIAPRLRCLGFTEWKLDLAQTIDEISTGWSRTEIETQIYLLLSSKLAWYERMEGLSLLELAVWQAKMDMVRKKHGQRGEKQDVERRVTIDRPSCRINSQAGVVMHNVLRFLRPVGDSSDGYDSSCSDSDYTRYNSDDETSFDA